MAATKNYFEDILSSNIVLQQSCLDKLVEELNGNKERTIYNFLGDSGSEDFLWSLVNLLSSEDCRIASNASYVIGSLAETELGSHRVLSITKGKRSATIIQDLTNMLSSEDSECVMNAAGTLGTLAETGDGRSWMLTQPCINDTLMSITNLLSCENHWAASNAALVLARITISEEGCLGILKHENSSRILTRLIQSLGNDVAGRGMNAAFAIGRLLDMSPGKERLLNCPDTEKMITSLCRMLTKGDTGSAKNACFAVSCLAGDGDGNQRILSNAAFSDVTNRLLLLLANEEDIEAAWFAAMTLRTISSHRRGVLRLWENQAVLDALNKNFRKSTNSKELNEEIEKTLLQLKRLDRPNPPTVQVTSSTSMTISWDRAVTKSGLDITYKLYDGSKVVYKGKESKTDLMNLTPNTSYCFKLRLSTAGDESAFSETVIVSTEEGYPSAPTALRVIASSPSQIRISWGLPENPNGTLRGYSIYLGEKLIDTTYELSHILSRLQASTSYTIHVCASTSKGVGEKATVHAHTVELGAHAPERPSVTVIGRNEVHVTWNPPSVPLGRFFRYELMANKEVIYSGTEKSFYATNLVPDSDYSFTVCAITSEGRCESEPTKKKTPKDKSQTEPGRHASKTRSFKAKEFQLEKAKDSQAEKPKALTVPVRPKHKHKKRTLARPSSSVSSVSEKSIKYHHGDNQESWWSHADNLATVYPQSPESDSKKISNSAVLTGAPIKVDIQPLAPSAGQLSMFLRKSKSEYPIKSRTLDRGNSNANRLTIEPVSWNEMFSAEEDPHLNQALKRQLLPKSKVKTIFKPETLENERSFINLITNQSIPRANLRKIAAVSAARNQQELHLNLVQPELRTKRERRVHYTRHRKLPSASNSSESSNDDAMLLPQMNDITHKLQPLSFADLIAHNSSLSKLSTEHRLNFDDVKAPVARLRTPSKGYWSDYDAYPPAHHAKKKLSGLAPINYKTFKGVHRPSKALRQESPLVNETWLTDLPNGGEKNKYKFIPTQLRTQPLHLPKAGKRLESLTQLHLRKNSSLQTNLINHGASAFSQDNNSTLHSFQPMSFGNAPKATRTYLVEAEQKAHIIDRNASSPFKANLIRDENRHSPHLRILSHGDAV